MSILSSLIIGVVITLFAVFFFYKAWMALKRQARRKIEQHRLSIEPSLSFSIKEKGSSKPDVCVKNIGKGTALKVEIQDFHHPLEKNWHFKFQKIERLDSGQEAIVEFDFLVCDQKANNKTDLLWMFDPDHDHDFVAKLVLCFSDIEENSYRQTNRIGEGDYQNGKPQLLKKITG